MHKAMWLTAVAGVALIAQSGLDGAVAQTRTTLDIYVVDVEGGNATLLVAPSGESLLIDTGNVAPAAAIRDAERIMAAAKDARLTQIDNLVLMAWPQRTQSPVALMPKHQQLHFSSMFDSVDAVPAPRKSCSKS